MPPRSIRQKDVNKSTVGRRKLLYKHSHRETKTDKLLASTKATDLQLKREVSLDQFGTNEKNLDPECAHKTLCKRSFNRISGNSKTPLDKINLLTQEHVKGLDNNPTMLSKNDTSLKNSSKEFSVQTALLHSNSRTGNSKLSTIALTSSFNSSNELNENMNSDVHVVPVSKSHNNEFNKLISPTHTNESNKESKESSNVTSRSTESDTEESEETAHTHTSASKQSSNDDEDDKTETTTNTKVKEQSSNRSSPTSPVFQPERSTGCNRLLHSPIHMDDDGLPIPVPRPGLIQLPVSKANADTGMFCFCCKPSIRKLSKKVEGYEVKLGKDLQAETKLVLKDINKYRKSVRTALVDISDILFKFNNTLSEKWKSASPVDGSTLNQFSDFLQKVTNKLKVDVDWLERLANDLRNVESKPLTILGILHHLFHNEAVLSMESKNLVRKFRGERKHLEFHSHMEKLAVQFDQSICKGTGTIKLKQEKSNDKNLNTPSNNVNNNNNNNNNGTSDSISDNNPDESETLDMIMENLLSILQSPMLLSHALRKIAEVSKISKSQKLEKHSNLGKGDESLQSTEENKTLITAATVLNDKELSHAEKTSLKFNESQGASSLSKSTKKIPRSSRLLTEKNKTQQSNAFHSCLDMTSFYTTLFNVDSISNEGSQFQSFIEEADSRASRTLVKENSDMFTADDFLKSHGHLSSNKLSQNKSHKIQKMKKNDQEVSLKPKLIEVICKVNQLARANNRTIKRIRSLERFVGKKSSQRKRRFRKQRVDSRKQEHL